MNRIDQQMAFILHQRPFKNTSKIIDLFTKDFGRVSLVAKGVSRAGSRISGLLRPFNLLSISFSGRGEVKTLIDVESKGNPYALKALSLYCGYYLNELILKLLAKEDPYETVFGHYQTTLLLLEKNQHIALSLRQFEYKLLSSMGHGFDLQFDQFNCPIIDAQSYIFDHGLAPSNDAMAISAICLKKLTSPIGPIKNRCAHQLKNLLRDQINTQLSGRPLKSRQLMHDFIKLSSKKNL